MTRFDLYSVSLKIFGLYFFIQSIINLKDFLFMVIGDTLSNGDFLSIWLFSGILLTALIEFIAGYILTFKTNWIIKRITTLGSERVQISTHRIDLLEVGIAVISIILITYSGAELFSHFVQSTYFHDHRDSEYLILQTKRPIFYAVFKLVAGIFLLINSRHFSNLIIRRGERTDARKNDL